MKYKETKNTFQSLLSITCRKESQNIFLCHLIGIPSVPRGALKYCMKINYSICSLGGYFRIKHFHQQYCIPLINLQSYSLHSYSKSSVSFTFKFEPYVKELVDVRISFCFKYPFIISFSFPLVLKTKLCFFPENSTQRKPREPSTTYHIINIIVVIIVVVIVIFPSSVGIWLEQVLSTICQTARRLNDAVLRMRPQRPKLRAIQFNSIQFNLFHSNQFMVHKVLYTICTNIYNIHGTRKL